VQAGLPADLDPTVLELLKKAYHRRVLTLGRVTPDQYLLSKYSVSRFKKMAAMIVETTNWTDNEVTGNVILDRVGLRTKQTRLGDLEKQFVLDATKNLLGEN